MFPSDADSISTLNATYRSASLYPNQSIFALFLTSPEIKIVFVNTVFAYFKTLRTLSTYPCWTLPASPLTPCRAASHLPLFLLLPLHWWLSSVKMKFICNQIKSSSSITLILLIWMIQYDVWLEIKEGCCYQIGWIFGKGSKGGRGGHFQSKNLYYHFWYPPKRPKLFILGVLGTSGAQITILRPLFNTITHPKTPIQTLFW